MLNLANMDFRDRMGNFLVDAFHNRIFDISSDGLVEKKSLQNYYDRYNVKNGLLNGNKIVNLQKRNHFFEQTSCSTHFKINMNSFLNYRNKAIHKMDDLQKNKQDTRDDTSFSELEYRNGGIQPVDPSFKLSKSRGCYVCMLNCSSKADFREHIAAHGPGIEFKFLRNGLLNGEYDQMLHACYKRIKNDSFFVIKLSNVSSIDVVIEKLIVFSQQSMTYITDKKVHLPCLLAKGNTKTFSVRYNQFYLGHKYPLVIAFHSKADKVLKYFEQHNFELIETLPTIHEVAVSVIKKESLKLYDIADYYPLKKIEYLFINRNVSEEAIENIDSQMLDFIKNGKKITEDNFQHVFDFLVQLEDCAISQKYRELNQYGKRIKLILSNVYRVQLSAIKNRSFEDTLGENDELILTRIKDRRVYLFGRIKKIDGNRLYFKFDNRKNEYEDLDNAEIFRYNISFFPSRLQIIFQREALNNFDTKPFAMPLLFPVVRCPEDPQSIEVDFYNKSLAENQEQKQAVINILSERKIDVPYIIFGPPGTGKTTTVVEVIIQLLKRSPENFILLTASSNAACDEVASRLCKYLLANDCKQTDFIRIYAASMKKKMGQLDENVIEASNLATGIHCYPDLETICSYRVVICTLCISGKLVQAQMRSTHFTHVFIDECGASTEPETLIPIVGLMSPKCRLILAGDPKQLGPILSSEKASELGLGKSLLERLLDRDCYQKNANGYDQTILTKLIKNFRTHCDILKISNTLYYDKGLIPCAAKDLTDWACGWHWLPNKNFPILFQSVIGETVFSQNSPSLSNHEEVDMVMNYVKDIMFFGINGRRINESEIGIVTPYKDQFKNLRATLDARKWFGIETGSVETFQGREKPIIILSLVRSKTKTAGFLKNPKRLNVSITRPQALLIIIGNPNTLQKVGDWKYVIDYCKANKAFRETDFFINDRGHSKQKNKPDVHTNISSITSGMLRISVDREKNIGKIKLQGQQQITCKDTKSSTVKKRRLRPKKKSITAEETKNTL